jgi:glycosyltransferase involved in cell wall biosynthesis
MNPLRFVPRAVKDREYPWQMASIVQRVLRQVVPGRRLRGELLLVGDEAGWILDEVAEQLARHLPADIGRRSISTAWPAARHCTIHFLDRAWAWSDGVLDRIDASNRLIAVWWHGRLDSPSPIIQAALGRLREQHQRFTRLQVTCSSGRRTLEALGVPPQKIVTLPVGVDLRSFRPVPDDAARSAARRAVDAPEGAAVVGCFQKDGDGWGDGSAPKLIKGPDILADALALLHERHPIHVLVPGPARGYLAGRLAAAGISFSAPGMVPRTDLPRLYHALDLYVSPSRDEGGPAGVLEAMASGVAVVSTRTGIPADLIAHGRNGLLVDVGDARALAWASATLIEDTALRASVARAGLASVEPYAWPTVVARYASELYRPIHARG